MTNLPKRVSAASIITGVHLHWYLGLVVLLMLLSALFPRSEGFLPPEGTRLLIASPQDAAGDKELRKRLRSLILLSLAQNPGMALYPEGTLLRTRSASPHGSPFEITAEEARRICLNEELPFFILPRMGRLGSRFFLAADLVAVTQESAHDYPEVVLRVGTLEETLLHASSIAGSLGRIMAVPHTRLNPSDAFGTRDPEALTAYAEAVSDGPNAAPDRQIPWLRRAIRTDSEFGLAHGELGKAYLGLGREEEARYHFEEAVRFPAPGFPRENAVFRGLLSAARHDFEAADKEVEFLRTTYSKDPVAHLWAAQIALKSHDLPKSMEAMRAALRLDPDRADSNLCLASVLLYNGDPTSARQALQNALRLRPDSTGCLLLGGILDVVDNNPRSGIEAMDKLRASSSAVVRSLASFLSAQVQIYQGRISSATATLLSGIAEDRESGDRVMEGEKRLALARLYLLLGEREPALEQCSAIPQTLTDPARIAAVGRIQARLSALTEAKDRLARLAGLPQTPWTVQQALLLEAEIDLASNRTPQAILLLEKARVGKHGFSPYEILARAYLQAGRWEEAQSEYRSIAERKPEMLFPSWSPWFTGDWVQSLYRTAQCLESLGRSEEAKQFYRNFSWVLEGSGGEFPGAKEAGEALRRRPRR